MAGSQAMKDAAREAKSDTFASVRREAARACGMQYVRVPDAGDKSRRGKPIRSSEFPSPAAVKTMTRVGLIVDRLPAALALTGQKCFSCGETHDTPADYRRCDRARRQAREDARRVMTAK